MARTKPSIWQYIGYSYGRVLPSSMRDWVANDLAGKDSQEISSLRQVVANLDDYKQVGDLTIPFAFNKYMLTAKDKDDLDNMVAGASKNKRYFIAVEGFTDRTGTRQYNEMLSRKRADSVVEYLVAKHDIPIFRIHMIGLGEQKPVDDGRTRAARAKNRRVEVKVFSADQVTAGLNADANANRSQDNK